MSDSNRCMARDRPSPYGDRKPASPTVARGTSPRERSCAQWPGEGQALALRSPNLANRENRENPAHILKILLPNSLALFPLTSTPKSVIINDMNAERTINTLLNQIRDELLPQIARGPALQSAENLHRFRSSLHSVHYACIRAQFPLALRTQVETLLATSADLWNLITENELTLKNLKDYTRVRTFSAEAEGLTNLEELISGEDSLRDVMINGIAFMLNWKANSIWVDSAKRARTVMAKNYMLEIQDRIWQFIKESTAQTDEMDIAQAEQVRERADRFLALIHASELPTEAHVGLLMQIYVLLLRLQLGRLIIQLENLRDNGTV